MPAAGLPVSKAGVLSYFLLCCVFVPCVCVFRVLRFINFIHHAAVAEIALPVEGQFVPECSQNAPLPTEFLASTRM